VANRQPAGKAFHSCLVDPDPSIAGDPVYAFAAHRLEHLDVFESIWHEWFMIDFVSRQVQNFIG